MIKDNVIKNTETINEIIQIEANAQELVKDAKREQSELPLRIATMLETYKDQYHDRALTRIRYVRIAEEELAKEKIDQIHKDHDEKLGKLKKLVDDNMDSWVETIYSSITKLTEI